MPTLPLSHALTIGNFDLALEQAADACDLSSLRFIDAYGLVGTACALRVALADRPDLLVRVPSSETARGHLTAMGFRDFLSDVERESLLPAEPAFDPSDVVIPLRSATSSGGAQALHHLLWGQLRDHVDPQVLGAVAEGVWEMVANALEHSGADALIMGQVYRASRGGRPPDHDDRVQVVVGDVGRGIRGSFLETDVHHPEDDLQAINLALQYLVTSVPDDAGRGQGLATTLEQVLELQGRMVVRSGTARVSIESGAKHEETVAALPGVIVALSLPLYPG
jgi:hypothetical protein